MTNKPDQEPATPENESPRIVDRREFLGSSMGAAALGAAVITGGGAAMAQDPKHHPVFGTPDWKTLEPGAKDSDNYAEKTGIDEDEDLTWWAGRNVGGVTVGLIQFRANLPMAPGNMGNASTFDFPILYREMAATNALDVMSLTPKKQFTEAAIEAAKWLELQGVRAIMGNCGFWGNYQNVVQDAIDTPFFSSSLMQLPMMVRSMPKKQKVAVITANGPLLARAPAIDNCGLSAEDKANRIVIGGCETGKAFADAMSCNGKLNPKAFGEDIYATVKQVMDNNSDIGAILLECTELSPYASVIQERWHVPVWDYTSLTRWIHSGCVRRPFTGFV